MKLTKEQKLKRARRALFAITKFYEEEVLAIEERASTKNLDETTEEWMLVDGLIKKEIRRLNR